MVSELVVRAVIEEVRAFFNAEFAARVRRVMVCRSSAERVLRLFVERRDRWSQHRLAIARRALFRLREEEAMLRPEEEAIARAILCLDEFGGYEKLSVPRTILKCFEEAACAPRGRFEGYQLLSRLIPHGQEAASKIRFWRETLECQMWNAGHSDE